MKSAANKPRSRIRRQPVMADVVESQMDLDVDGNDVAAVAGGDNHIYDDDDGDEIVREIPVYLSPALSRHLHLLQYPLQQNPHWTPPEAARIKPRHIMVEIDYPTPDNIHLHGSYHMPSRTFTSHTVPVSTHMALGKIMVMNEDTACIKQDDHDDILADSSGEDEVEQTPRLRNKNIGLHLIPLSRITQMRPSFSHIDEAVASASATTEDELKQQQEQRLAEQTAAQNMERKPISLQKKESERAALARKSSYGFKKASEEAESWQNLEVFDETSEQARSIIMREVPCSRPMDNLLQQKVQLGRTSSARQSLNELYVGNLNYLPPPDLPVDGQPLSSTSSIDEANVSCIVAKLVRLMHQGWPIPYSLLRTQFSSLAVSDASLFVALGSCAVLVRGNFCLASRLLSLPSPAMTQARTFLLFLFQTLRVVHRARLEHVFSPRMVNGNNGPHHNASYNDEVTPAVLQMLLEQVGKKTHEGWVLKVDDDVTFFENHPLAALVHEQYWAQQQQRFKIKLQRYREPLDVDIERNTHYSRSYLENGGDE